MSAEIERKYTVKDQSYRQESIECKYYKQGYISIDKERTVRIRISGNNAFITLKGVTTGCTRKEFEYPIPVADAAEMLGSLCLPSIIEKKRYIYPYAGHRWEIDEFMDNNDGLVIAEIEHKIRVGTIRFTSFHRNRSYRRPRYYNSNCKTPL